MLTVGLYGIKDTTHGSRPTYTHDHSVALMRDGRVEDVVSLERITRRKHDNRLVGPRRRCPSCSRRVSSASSADRGPA